MAHPIKLHHLHLHDGRHDTSLVRELEMAVEALCQDVGHPGYAIQFFRDVELYGIDEAKTYLLRFVDGKVSRPEEVIEVSRKIEAIHEAFMAVGK